MSNWLVQTNTLQHISLMLIREPDSVRGGGQARRTSWLSMVEFTEADQE